MDVDLRAKLGLVLVAAITPAGAQGLEHGHKLGTSVTYLEETGDVRDGAPLFITNGAGTVQITMRRADGSAVPIVIGPVGGGSATGVFGQTPCALFEAWAEQVSSDFAESTQAGVADVERTKGKAVFHRFVRDDLRKIYASYTVTVDKLPEEGTYRVSFGPPTGELPAQVRGADWKILTPAKYPAPQIVRDEDSIRLELYTNGATRRVVDYVHAGRQDRMVLRKETPRDSYADDAEIVVTQPRLRINGLAGDAVAAMPETIRGPLVWIYVPGHGRYELSLQAHAELGFEDAGEVSGNSLTFTAPDGNVFRIDTAERIAAGSGIYTVHVLTDSGWLPADPPDRSRVMIGAAPGVIGPGGAGGR
ncbi:MAG TPA: hypothetical protein VGG72_12670 [Bryobacteraceae bacterium]|jgi:hypothetical protein